MIPLAQDAANTGEPLIYNNALYTPEGRRARHPGPEHGLSGAQDPVHRDQCADALVAQVHMISHQVDERAQCLPESQQHKTKEGIELTDRLHCT
eukprot:CAMPEP_0180523184 /NCGR_PEP_ID=MMETSP1036_2-20121128/57865_1 /TAXON_ID=632150 /ORGANISM="Azadinium spinosum, Strain 3D9" /LENGTH=93 /DNA_ID=CAMNT_0022536131 /DNA_START=23 /DNA_END=300 /DNA_ORIENTATION=+